MGELNELFAEIDQELLGNNYDLVKLRAWVAKESGKMSVKDMLHPALSAVMSEFLNAKGVPVDKYTSAALGIGYTAGYLYGRYPKEVEKASSK